MMIQSSGRRRLGALLTAFTMVAAIVFLFGSTANAAIVPTVPLATTQPYAVLGGTTVTNTGPSVLNGSLGLWPGTSNTGFPPGIVVPPGVRDLTNARAHQAKLDLTAAYVNAAGRPIDGTTTADLANLHLQAGVYAGPSKGALALNGPLVLDGAGNANSVFIFQTNSSLITGSSSTVTLINGAQECNVFWQVGSSATLGTGSVFRGNILALSSITVTTGVTVHGRALARNGAVTLDTDVFVRPTCAGTTPVTPTTTTAGTGTGGTATPAAGTATGTGTGTGTTSTGLTSSTAGPGVPGVSGPPRTGGAALRVAGFPWATVLYGFGFVGALMAGTVLALRTQSRLALRGAPSRRRGH
jgi:Ice-binding-like